MFYDKFLEVKPNTVKSKSVDCILFIVGTTTFSFVFPVAPPPFFFYLFR